MPRLAHRRIAASFLACLLICSGLASRGQEPTATLTQQATQAEQRRQHDRAIELWTQILAKNPERAEAYYRRGREYFCAGKIEQAVADLDKYVELNPDARSRQWERGIAYYYAGKYPKGAEQFALYQTFHDQDVENSAWRYLCVARSEGIEKAQANMLPIDNDPRVPMMQIYELYRGKLKPEDVERAARAGDPTREELNARLFYTHLYLGLWHEAAGRSEQAKEHIYQAEQHKIGHYMWDVAHVHAERLRAGMKVGP